MTKPLITKKKSTTINPFLTKKLLINIESKTSFKWYKITIRQNIPLRESKKNK